MNLPPWYLDDVLLDTATIISGTWRARQFPDLAASGPSRNRRAISRWLRSSLREKRPVCICGRPVHKVVRAITACARRPASSPGRSAHHELVDVDVWCSSDGPDDAIGDVGAGQWLHPAVDRSGPLPVALEPDQAEFRLDHPGRDLGHPNRLPHELEPQRLTDGADGMLTRRVAD